MKVLNENQLESTVANHNSSRQFFKAAAGQKVGLGAKIHQHTHPISIQRNTITHTKYKIQNTIQMEKGFFLVNDQCLSSMSRLKVLRYNIYHTCYTSDLIFHLTSSKWAASRGTNQLAVQLIIGDFHDGQPR